MVIAEAKAKEISQRSFDARNRFVVPIDSQHEFLEVVGLGTRNGDPDMRQQPGAICIQKRKNSAGINLAKIRVRASGI